MRAYQALTELWKKFDNICKDVAAGLDERNWGIEERMQRPGPTPRSRKRRPAALRRRGQTGSD